MLAYALASQPCSEATDIGYILSGGSGCFNPANLWGNLMKGQKNEAAWETKFQRIDTKMHKKNYYFYILKQQYECQTLMTQLFKKP